MTAQAAETPAKPHRTPPATPAKTKVKTQPLVLPPRGALPLPTWFAYSGALLSGLLYWLAFPGMDVWPLTFVAFVPLIVAIHRQAPRRALALGLVSGLTMNLAGFYWLQEMLKVFSGFPAPICVLFVIVICTYQGGRLGLMGWLYARGSARGWPARLLFVGAFAASELLYPLLFPWYYAATAHKVPLLTQTAELGGPILVGVVLVAANFALAEPLLARVEGRRIDLRPILAGLVALGASIGFSAWRVSAIEARMAGAEPAKVGLVQANMGLLEKRNDAEGGLERHLRLTRALREQGIDFVVWSETSVVHASREERYQQELPLLVSRRIGLPAIFGAVLYQRDPRPLLFNTAVSSDATGQITARYDKTFLLMFGEYLPFGETFPVLYEWSPHSGHFSQGTSLKPLLVDVGGKTHPVSMLVCYEDILPTFTNSAVAEGKPELLVNMTNDAWFGDTTEPWEHLALAKFRAIEHRRYLVRSTNSGVSAVVDPVGRVVDRDARVWNAETREERDAGNTAPFQQETLRATIRWMTGSTVYEAVRDWPWWAVSAAVVAFAFVKRRPVPAPLPAAGADVSGVKVS